MGLLGIIMILSPLFIIVAIWAVLGERLWAKILTTVIAVVSIVAMAGGGIISLELDDAEAEIETYETAVDVVMHEFLSYDDCIKLALDYDSNNMLNDCNLAHYEFVMDVLTSE